MPPQKKIISSATVWFFDICVETPFRHDEGRSETTKNILHRKNVLCSIMHRDGPRRDEPASLDIGKETVWRMRWIRSIQFLFRYEMSVGQDNFWDKDLARILTI